MGKHLSTLHYVLLSVAALSALLQPFPSAAERAVAKSEALLLHTVTGSKPLSNGIELRSGAALLQITALRDDILRIRIGAQGELPEDASWAVLKTPRQSSVAVTPASDANIVGFSTKSMRVSIARATMAITITNLEGNIIQASQPGFPIEYNGTTFRVTEHSPADEHYFGLGDKAGPLDRRNQAYTMWNTDAFGYQESTDPLYKTIPFFLSVHEGRTTGVFMDNTWRSSFDFDKQQHDAYSFGAENGPLDYYVMYGPEPKQVLGAYAWLTGTTPLPPLWSLGYQQSRYSYYPESQVREIANRLRADKIPTDVLWLDIDYQKENRPFTVDTARFPNFAKMIADLKQQQFHIVTIVDLHIAKLPNAGYVPYDSGIAQDHFVKLPDGSTYTGVVWPGPAVFPEFTQASTRAWWGELFKPFMADGVSGFWNDMNEPAIFNVPTKTMPDDVQDRIDEPGFKKRTTSQREIHNVYGMENSRATYEGMQKIAPTMRPFVMTRASYAGGQRYSATWTGDNSSTWNHLRMTTPMLLNLGLSGFAMSGADVGGYAGTPQADLLTRWTELAAFQPIDRDHTAKGTAFQEPWVNGPEQENIRRRFIEERYRLMSYLYTTAEEMSRTGVPITRPLFVEFPDATADKHPLDLDAGAEFMFGPDMLVAPAPYPDELDTYEVQFPPVDWYDYWTGEKIARRAKIGSHDGEQMKGVQQASANTPVLIHPALDTLPVYVREGSILPMQPLVQSTAEVPQGPLTLRVYPPNVVTTGPARECKGSVYGDDGVSTSYQHGVFLRMQFTCAVSPDGIIVHFSPHEGSYPAWWKQLRVEVFGAPAGQATATLSGDAAQPLVSYEHDRRALVTTIPDEGHGGDLHIAYKQ